MTSSIMMTSREHLNPPSSFEDLEKGKTEVTVQESESIHNVNEKDEDIQWTTGFWNRFPWIGIGALTVMLICIAFTGIVLGTSKDKAREEWPAYERWHWVKGSWKKKAQIDPHVLLAIINTVTNVSLAIAIGQGIAIAWWRRALKGSTVEDLHRSWSFSSSVLDLLCAGRKFNLIALCALTAKLALIDNVLLQKAAGTGPGFFPEHKITTWLPMERELPANYAGGTSPDGSVGGTSAAFSWDLTDYIHDSIIDPTHIYNPDEDYVGFDTQCSGICYPYFEGFGFKFDCTAADELESYPVTPDLAAQNTQKAIQTKLDTLLNSTINGTSFDASAYDAVFNTTLQRNPLLEVKAEFIPAGTLQEVAFSGLLPKAVQSKSYDSGTIGVRIRYSNLTANNGKDESICTGKTWLRYCSLLPSVIEYPLVITNITHDDETVDVSSISSSENGIKLTSNVNFTLPDSGETFTGDQFRGLRVVRDAYQPYDQKYNTNLEKIATFLQTNFGALVLLEYLKGNGSEGIYSPNALSEFYSTSSPSLFGQWWPTYDPSNSCVIEIPDPLDDLGTALNNLMVRSSMRAATDTVLNDDNWGVPILAMNQSYVNRMYIPTVFFKTDWWYGGAAMIVIFLCVLCVLPSYYGFWELGRKVTLAPMEVSAALQAPILEHPVVAHSGDVKQLVKEIGDRPIRYGEVDGQHRLGVAGPSQISSPAAHHR